MLGQEGLPFSSPRDCSAMSSIMDAEESDSDCLVIDPEDDEDELVSFEGDTSHDDGEAGNARAAAQPRTCPYVVVDADTIGRLQVRTAPLPPCSSALAPVGFACCGVCQLVTDSVPTSTRGAIARLPWLPPDVIGAVHSGACVCSCRCVALALSTTDDVCAHNSLHVLNRHALHLARQSNCVHCCAARCD